MKRSRPTRATRLPGVNIVQVAAVVLIVVAGLVLFNAIRTTTTARTARWDAPPAMQINVDASYTATLKTDKGEIVIELMPALAPLTVNNFVFLARQGYYDGVTFHRVLPGFMAQTGDPTGTGAGGPGYTFADETSNGLVFDAPGLVAMANIGQPDSNGSQFFITYAETPHLNGQHTIFGRVTSGMDVALALTPRDPQDNPDAPPGDSITSVTITEN
jgi:cyclophilin family peptidyl-prolyl cis-trans isomerase